MSRDVTTTSSGEGAARVPVRKATQCQCGKEGTHFNELAMDVVLPGTPEQIYNLMFASGFVKDFMREGQKLESTSCCLSPLIFITDRLNVLYDRYPDLGLGTFT